MMGNSILVNCLKRIQFIVWYNAFQFRRADCCPHRHVDRSGVKVDFSQYDKYMVLPCCHLKIEHCNNKLTCCVCEANVKDIFKFLRYFVLPPEGPNAVKEAVRKRLLEGDAKPVPSKLNFISRFL
jgi:hypothetical protein